MSLFFGESDKASKLLELVVGSGFTKEQICELLSKATTVSDDIVRPHIELFYRILDA